MINWNSDDVRIEGTSETGWTVTAHWYGARRIVSQGNIWQCIRAAAAIRKES